MIPTEKSLLPNWRAFAPRGPLYVPLDGNSGSNAIEIPQFNGSVFLALQLMFASSIDLGTNFNLQPNIILSNMHRLFERRPQQSIA